MKIIVIDDDPYVLDMLKAFLEKEGYHVDVRKNGKEGLGALKSDVYDLAFVDLIMPELDGVSVIEKSKELNINTPIVIITAYASIETAVKAMRLGAYDYISKPFNLEEIKLLVKRVNEYNRLKKENKLLKKQLSYYAGSNNLIGSSSVMQEVFSFIDKIADTDSTVLITGESGTGKEVVAKAIHYKSSRFNEPFVPLNCAAIPKDLLESELFGHEKGSFTGAIQTRLGRFERANKGTIFLDEIAELHPSLQAKMLRVIQEKEFERVGGVKTIKVDVRIIAATNKNLEDEVKKGTFREDLFYRLNVLPINLPPLRERKEDIPLLIHHFLDVHAKKRKMKKLRIDNGAMQCLQSYKWPGNVRELENLIERLTILDNDGLITIPDLPDRMRNESYVTEDMNVKVMNFSSNIVINEDMIPPNGVNLNKVLEEMEKKYILQALHMAQGVKKKAAELLSLNRTTLIEKMKKLRIN